MQRGSAKFFVFSVLVIAALGTMTYWALKRGDRDICGVCRRPIHAEARAAIEVNGQREPVCCARCAVTLGRQQHKAVKLVEVTDYISRKPMLPDSAWYVEGSRLILCEKDEPLFDETKQPHNRVFDRCVPSLYAFARREDAEAFARDNGGTVVRLADLMKEVEAQP